MQVSMSKKHSWRSLLRATDSTRSNGAAEAYSPAPATIYEPELRRPNGSELGRHANEEKMPRWLRKVLESGDEMVVRDVIDPEGRKSRTKLKVVETPGVVDALARIARADPNTARARFCDPRVHHVSRLRREGSFCGYRNIQMLVSYICNAKVPGHESFPNQTFPSIFELQDLIETAWEQGYNTSSRDEIGHIRMTRKFIGTSEVEALLTSLKLPVARRGFASTEKTPAIQCLLEYVSEYFGLQQHPLDGDRVMMTQKSPIFLQRPGHSMTIVGVHQDSPGKITLMVFDPKFRVRKEVRDMAVAATSPVKSQNLLKLCRYGLPELATYDVFDIVHLDGHVIAPT